MKTVNAFYLDESPTYPGKYMIFLNHDSFFCTHTEGSYNLLPARILGLNYAWYLRMCRDELGAEIYGKGHKYPVVCFKNRILANQLVELLNKEATQIVWDRTHDIDEMREALNNN